MLIDDPHNWLTISQLAGDRVCPGQTGQICSIFHHQPQLYAAQDRLKIISKKLFSFGPFGYISSILPRRQAPVTVA